MSQRPLILVSNDDGVLAEGVQALRRAASLFADVVVVAPEHEQSALSHSITLHRPLRHRELEPGIHAVDGTPADCIYVALYRQGLLSRKPDLVLSGINHGLNLGSDVFYSGTVAAAREAALRGIPAVAFSLALGGDMKLAQSIVQKICECVLRSLPQVTNAPLLNINIPVLPRGILATRLGRRLYADEVTVREDPRGRQYYWIGGSGVRHESFEGSDTLAHDQSYISVTPLLLDATHPQSQPLVQELAQLQLE